MKKYMFILAITKIFLLNGLGQQYILTDEQVVELENNYIRFPKISMSDTNSFAIAWLDDANLQGYSWYNVTLRTYNMEGDTLSEIFQFVNSEDLNNSIDYLILDRKDGIFSLAGVSIYNNLYYLYSQSFRAGGQKVGRPIICAPLKGWFNSLESVFSSSNNLYIAYSTIDSGAFIVKFDTLSSANSEPIFIQFYPEKNIACVHMSDSNYVSIIWGNGWNTYYLTKFNLKGDSIFTELLLDKSDEDYRTDHLKLKTDSTGNYILSWNQYRVDVNSDEIYLQIFDKDANPLSPEVLVNDGNSAYTSYIYYYCLDVNVDGRVAVAWMDYRNDNKGSTYVENDTIDIYMQLFDKEGNKFGGNYRVNTEENKSHTYPDLEIMGERMYFVWQEVNRIYLNILLWPEEISMIKNISKLTNSDITVAPNPFTRFITFVINLESDLKIDINIYDIYGRLVANILDDVRGPGKKMIKWNATDNSGNSLPKGVYFYTIEYGSSRHSGKILYITD